MLLSDEAAGRPLSRAAIDELARPARPGGGAENDASTAAVIDHGRRNAEARDAFVAEFPVVGGVLRALGDCLSAWQIALWWISATGSRARRPRSSRLRPERASAPEMVRRISSCGSFFDISAAPSAATRPTCSGTRSTRCCTKAAPTNGSRPNEEPRATVAFAPP